MDFQLKTLGLARACAEKCDALVLLVDEDFKPGRDALSTLATDALAAQALGSQAGKMLSAWRPAGVTAPRVLMVGAGDGSGRAVRTAVRAAVGALKGTRVRKLLVCLPEGVRPAGVHAAVSAASETTYAYTATKSKAEPRELTKVIVAVADATRPGLQARFEAARGTALGIEFARELGNLPPNIATPTYLGQRARLLAREGGFQCQVLGPKEVAKLGMGSFMAVARGSHEPLRFIVLKYQGAAASVSPVVLVGKGITFDSGGISIKPAAEMDEMKFDMGGAASVLGTFRALAALKPRLNVIGLIPSCENLPDGRALKPGDVVTSMSGQTIEVLNTDAEGRLILCDALTYAERFEPCAVVDIATLTGACVVALGAVRSGLFSSDDELAQALLDAGESALDPCWRMPLDEDYAEGLKTHFADVANVGGRQGGAITAAKFLQRFARMYPWAHLDIAGTAWRGGAAKGATGRPVGLLVDYLLSQQPPATRAAKKAGPAPKAASAKKAAPAKKASRARAR